MVPKDNKDPDDKSAADNKNPPTFLPGNFTEISLTDDIPVGLDPTFRWSSASLSETPRRSSMAPHRTSWATASNAAAAAAMSPRRSIVTLWEDKSEQQTDDGDTSSTATPRSTTSHAPPITTAARVRFSGIELGSPPESPTTTPQEKMCPASDPGPPSHHTLSLSAPNVSAVPPRPFSAILPGDPTDRSLRRASPAQHTKPTVGVTGAITASPSSSSSLTAPARDGVSPQRRSLAGSLLYRLTRSSSSLLSSSTGTQMTASSTEMPSTAPPSAAPLASIPPTAAASPSYFSSSSSSIFKRHSIHTLFHSHRSASPPRLHHHSSSSDDLAHRFLPSGNAMNSNNSSNSNSSMSGSQNSSHAGSILSTRPLSAIAASSSSASSSSPSCFSSCFSLPATVTAHASSSAALSYRHSEALRLEQELRKNTRRWASASVHRSHIHALLRTASSAVPADDILRDTHTLLPWHQLFEPPLEREYQTHAATHRFYYWRLLSMMGLFSAVLLFGISLFIFNENTPAPYIRPGSHITPSLYWLVYPSLLGLAAVSCLHLCLSIFRFYRRRAPAIHYSAVLLYGLLLDVHMLGSTHAPTIPMFLLYALVCYTTLYQPYLYITSIVVTVSLVKIIGTVVAIYGLHGTDYYCDGRQICGRALAIEVLFYAMVHIIGIYYAKCADRASRMFFLQSRDLESKQASLQREHDRADRLCRSIMPLRVYADLKTTANSPSHVLAPHHPLQYSFDHVSILFADIVNFTRISGMMDAGPLVNLLNTLFGKFDEIVDAYGLEKIKTIGDCYMLCGGVPEPLPHGDLKTVAAAADFLEACHQTLSVLQIRVGLHTGSVMAGLIGQQALSFDVWSRDVVVASRIEQHAVPQGILVSAALRRRLEEAQSGLPEHEQLLFTAGPEIVLWADEGDKEEAMLETSYVDYVPESLKQRLRAHSRRLREQQQLRSSSNKTAEAVDSRRSSSVASDATDKLSFVPPTGGTSFFHRRRAARRRHTVSGAEGDRPSVLQQQQQERRATTLPEETHTHTEKPSTSSSAWSSALCDEMSIVDPFEDELRQAMHWFSLKFRNADLEQDYYYNSFIAFNKTLFLLSLLLLLINGLLIAVSGLAGINVSVYYTVAFVTLLLQGILITIVYVGGSWHSHTRRYSSLRVVRWCLRFVERVDFHAIASMGIALCLISGILDYFFTTGRVDYMITSLYMISMACVMFFRLRYLFMCALAIVSPLSFHLWAYVITGNTYYRYIVYTVPLVAACVVISRKMEQHVRRNYFTNRVLLKKGLDVEHVQLQVERFLTRLLPPPVIQRLRASPEGGLAYHVQEAGILFAAITHFNEYTAESVALLHEIVSQLDALCEQHDVIKVKTMGNVYMVATGILPAIHRPDRSPIKLLADYAFAMVACIQTINAQRDTHYQVRIGLCRGPLVAGVIGKRKFAFDTWGDTVNVASRMESTGLAGSIQTCEAGYEGLRDEFEMVERGLMEIKGKGPMTTYFVLGPRVKSEHENENEKDVKEQEDDEAKENKAPVETMPA